MGMKSKVTGSTSKGGNLSAGVHHVTIKDFKGLKNEKGDYVTNKNGEQAFVALFEGMNGGCHSDIFWYGEKSLWKLKNLFKSIQLHDDTVKYSDIIGKDLWLYLAQEYKNKDKTENPDRFEIVSFEYSVFTGADEKPSVMGDPTTKGQKIGGSFIIEIHQQLKEVPMPEPINGDTKEFSQSGITPNMDFFDEKESPFEDKPALSGFPEDEEEDEGF